MEFAEVVRRRRMVRNYDPDRPVPPEVLHRILGYALHAPSAGFSQGWHFLLLRSAEDRAAFWSATGDDPVTKPDAEPDPWLDDMRRATALIACFSDRTAYIDRYAEADKGWTDRSEARWPVPYWDIDTGMAALLMMLGVVDEGLGGCFFGVPTERHDSLRSRFGVPDRLTPVGVISLGYRAPDRRSPSLRRGRRPLSEVVSTGHYGNPLPDA